jgi:bifunctional DNA-binding transcriptional regulator/antitoxin component of YhaV-PrlF toxin-antitoxin module
MVSQVSGRGQITIDRAIRRHLGIQPGMIAYQRVVDGRLEVRFLPAPHRRSLFGVLHRPGEPAKVVTGEHLDQAVMEAVADERQRAERGDA